MSVLQPRQGIKTAMNKLTNNIEKKLKGKRGNPKNRKSEMKSNNIRNDLKELEGYRGGGKRKYVKPNGGDPEIKNYGAPSAINSYTKNRGIQMKASFNGKASSCVIKHTEFVATITGSSTFTVTSWNLNPGLPGTFPYGSKLANLFEEYEAVSLTAIFRPYDATSSAGAIMVAFDYDASDASPATQAAMLDLEGSVQGSIWAPVRCKANTKLLNSAYKSRYVRATTLSSNLDVKTYDMGKLFVAAIGASASVCGDLVLEYEFRLHVPQLDSATYVNALVARYCVDYYTSSATRTAPMTGLVGYDGYGRDCTSTAVPGTHFSVTGTDTINVPSGGDYLMFVACVGTTITATDWTFTLGTGGGQANMGYIVNATATIAQSLTRLTIPPFSSASSGTIVIGGGAAHAATVTDFYVRIAPYSYFSVLNSPMDVVPEEKDREKLFDCFKYCLKHISEIKPTDSDWEDDEIKHNAPLKTTNTPTTKTETNPDSERGSSAYPDKPKGWASIFGINANK